MRPTAFFAAAIALLLPTFSFGETTPEQGLAFIDAYLKAYKTGDKKAQMALLSTKGADPMVLEFYTMMMTKEAGSEVSSIEMNELTQDEVREAVKVQEGPDGGKIKLPLKPTKKLVIQTVTSEGNSKSTSTSKIYVAEIDGKLLIPVPVPVK